MPDKGGSNVAKRDCAWLITLVGVTRKSVDRNHSLLSFSSKSDCRPFGSEVEHLSCKQKVLSSILRKDIFVYDSES